MLIPVRCFSCGVVIGNKWNKYKTKLQEGKTEEVALNELKLTKYCCRRMMLSHVEKIDDHLAYLQASENKSNNQTVVSKVYETDEVLSCRTYVAR